MAAFGLTAALSGICFTVPQGPKGSPEIHYAAEKFLHSAVLLVQALMLLYVKQVLETSSWAHEHLATSRGLALVFGCLEGLVCSSAAWCWFWGFHAINSRLWKNWDRRIQEINHSESTEKNRPEDNASVQKL
jgi:hypothetical protein